MNMLAIATVLLVGFTIGCLAMAGLIMGTRSETTYKRNFKLTPEQRSARTAKGNVTRAANRAKDAGNG